MTVPIRLRNPEALSAPDYPMHAGEPVLRVLDPTEWNMERLNRVSNGAGCVYQIVRGRGAVNEASLREVVAKLSDRHPLLGARIVQFEGSLAYVRGGEPHVFVGDVPELDENVLSIVEADMNAGPSPCWRASPFRFALLREATDTTKWVIIVAGPHAHCDGISLAWLTHELLEGLGGGEVGGELPLRSIEVPSLPEPTNQVESSEPPPRMVAPEADVPSDPKRAELVSTGLIEAKLDRDTTRSLVQAVKANGITVHGAIGAAVHLALAARHGEVTGESPLGVYRAGSPVSMRPHLSPKLADADIRMAVDVAFTNTELRTTDDFWSLATRFGQSVREQISSQDILRSWNRTARKDRTVGSTGVPLALISNVGRSSIQPRYGSLEIEGTAGAMATHGMFQIDMLFTTFDGQLGGCFYFELPTVSRASMTRFVQRTMDLLSAPEVHAGSPTVGQLLADWN